MQKIFNKDGFIWWIGIVEDRLDPEYMGRCRVRIYGYHTDDKSLLPTEDLPWAIPILPITSASTSGLGISPLGPVTGTWVLGFFLDGADMQQPAFFGTIATNSPPVFFTPPQQKEEIKNTNSGKLLDSSGNEVLDGFGNPISTGTPPVDGWYLGKTTESFDVGSRSAGFINNYQSLEDINGAIYGLYGLPSFLPKTLPSGKNRKTSKDSPLESYIKYSKFKSFFENLTPATSSFDSKWREIASSNPSEFRDDQRNFIKKSYYEVMVSNLLSKGLDLTKFGPAVQDLIWSTALYVGPNRTDVFLIPLKDKSELSEKDIVNLVCQYKIINYKTFSKAPTETSFNASLSRFRTEKSSLQSLITY